MTGGARAGNNSSKSSRPAGSHTPADHCIASQHSADWSHSSPRCLLDRAYIAWPSSQSRFPRVLSMLRGKPRLLPENCRERQGQVFAELKTGRVMLLAKVVRDLTWHRKIAHLTKTDSDYLKQGRELLAAEMALVSGDAVSDASKLIEATVTAAMESTPNQTRSRNAE